MTSEFPHKPVTGTLSEELLTDARQKVCHIEFERYRERLDISEIPDLKFHEAVCWLVLGRTAWTSEYLDVLRRSIWGHRWVAFEPMVFGCYEIELSYSYFQGNVEKLCKLYVESALDSIDLRESISNEIYHK